MATKKQKRLAALERRAEFEEEIKRTGLEALRKDRERRKKHAPLKDDSMKVVRRFKKKTFSSQKRGPAPEIGSA